MFSSLVERRNSSEKSASSETLSALTMLVKDFAPDATPNNDRSGPGLCSEALSSDDAKLTCGERFSRHHNNAIVPM